MPTHTDISFDEKRVMSIRQLLQMLPNNPHPGFGLVLIWAFLRQDFGGRVKKCTSDADNLKEATNMLEACGDIQSALELILHNTGQKRHLSKACEGEERGRVSPKLAARIKREILGEVLPAWDQLEHDRQGRFNVREFIRVIPS